MQSRAREFGKLVGDNVDGVIFRPVERPTATAISVLNGGALKTTLQTVHYRFQWNGERISLLYAFDSEGTRIEPASLSGKEDCLAA